MTGEQMEIAAQPVADPRDVRAAECEAWLRLVLDSAKAMEREEREDGRWWTGATLANRMVEPVAKVAPALKCLMRRGAVLRDRLGVDQNGRPIFVWAVSTADARYWQQVSARHGTSAPS